MYELSPTDAHAAWQSGAASIIDVREQSEHDRTHVPGVMLIPMSEFLERIDELPSGELIIMCHVGGRSGQVAGYLSNLGTYGEVGNLTGGIVSWVSEGLPFAGEIPS